MNVVPVWPTHLFRTDKVGWVMMMICSKAIGEEGWVENLNKYRLSVVTIRADAPADDVITIMIVL